MIRETLEKFLYGDARKFEIGTRAPILFIHIPKTAGTSIRQFLANQYHARDVCPWNNWSEIASSDRDIRGYKLIQGHFGINIKDMLPQEFHTLTMLRDPIERTLSAIRHTQRDPQFHPLHSRIKGMTLSQILRDESLAVYFKNHQTGYLSGRQHPDAILKYLRNDKTRAHAEPWDIESPPDLDVAKNRLDAIEFVGICEEMETLFPSLCDKMLFHYPRFPPRINVAPRDDSVEITEEDLSVLRELNDLDIKLYHYAQLTRGAVSKQAFEPESHMRKLCTEGIYQVQSQSFRLDICDRIPGSGWYEAEAGRHCIRWTGPSTEFSLELPIEANANYRLRVRFMSPIKIREKSFNIVANGKSQPFRLRHWWRNLYTVSCVIGKETLARNTTYCGLVFQTQRVFRPSSRQSSDLRSLGVAVISIAFDSLGTP